MKDSDLMALADGEAVGDERELDQLQLDALARRKIEALGELGELVRGHIELSADAVPQKKLDAMWREIDKATSPEPQRAPDDAGLLRRVGRWFDHYRSHIITGAVSAGAVAALALILRGPGDPTVTTKGPVESMPVIEELDTPGGTGQVYNLHDEDGGATVIWVEPEDTVEGI